MASSQENLDIAPARELGIPALLSVPGITAVADGTMLHVDGTNGTVTIG